MSPGSRLLTIAVLVPPLLILTVGSGEAVPKNRSQCYWDFLDCLNKCLDKDSCGAYGEKDPRRADCLKDCRTVCELRVEKCYDQADKGTSKAPHTKVQPKVKAGGAETPDTGPTLHTKPKGGVQQ
jgi:hypothetical protein